MAALGHLMDQRRETPQRATGKHRGQSEKNGGNWELKEVDQSSSSELE